MMELKVLNNTLTAYSGRWETRLELPVEAEILIPDYLPAVFKIVKCRLEPVVLHNDLTGARWQGDGYLRCTVFYQSDEAGARLWRTEQKVRFEKTAELPAGRYAPGPAALGGETEYCNCRAVSERRIDIRGAYTLSVAALALEEQELPASLSGCGIEQRPLTLCGVTPAAAAEKLYTAQTTLPLPGDGEAILEIGGVYVPQSATVQTGQVSAQGTLRLEAVWRAAGEEEFTVRQKELTVQQTMEVENAAEGDTCCCWGEVLSATLTAPETGRGDPELTVQWKLHAELWRPVHSALVADAYSTECETRLTMAPCRLLQSSAIVEETALAAAEDDLPDPDTEVRGCFVTLGPPQAEAAEGAPQPAVRLGGRGVAHVLCADSRGELTCYDKPFSWQLPETWPGVPETFVPRLSAAAVRVNSSRSGGRLRVEAEIAVHGMLLAVQSCEAVGAVEPGEAFDEGADGPALYLYYAEAGERLFDIAKRYHARVRDLAAANRLESGPEAPQTTAEAACLLVPAAR